MYYCLTARDVPRAYRLSGPVTTRHQADVAAAREIDLIVARRTGRISTVRRPGHPAWTALLVGVESKTGAVATGARRRCCRRLSQNAGASIRPMAPCPVSAHRTGRADFPHPALRLVSRRGTRLRADRQRSHSVHPERAKHLLGRETPGPARRDLMPSPKKATHAAVDVVVDRSTGGRPGAVAEVGRPAAYRAVETIPALRPAPLDYPVGVVLERRV